MTITYQICAGPFFTFAKGEDELANTVREALTIGVPREQIRITLEHVSLAQPATDEAAVPPQQATGNDLR